VSKAAWLPADAIVLAGDGCALDDAPAQRKEKGMHVQIINFELQDLSEEDYFRVCDELAPAYAAVPGLLSKVWLADSDAGSYDGVYLWESRQAMEEFAQTELFNSVATHPNLAGITSTDFDVLEAPTSVTSGLLQAV